MAEYTANVVARAGAMLDQQLQVGVPMLQLTITANQL